MGVAPSLVARTSDIKDFKVDWSFNSWKVNPNLAIQTQPVWELFYNRKNLEKYQKASYLSRMASSLDVSLGTVSNELNDRRIGGAMKVNLYRQKDPLMVKGLYEDILQQYDQELLQLKSKEKQLLAQLDTTTKPAELAAVKNTLRENDISLTTFYSRRNTAIQDRAKAVLSDNWNASFIDFAVGRIYTYETDSAGSLKKLRLNRNTGSGAWVNFGLRLGKRGQLTGLARSLYYEEQLNFTLKDDATGEMTPGETVGNNTLFTFGMNLRYGGPVYNFFAEFVMDRKAIKTPIEALNESFRIPNGKSVITSTVKWDIVAPYNLSFGGDWRISRNVILNYGIRVLMDKNFKTTAVRPLANISCMMR